MFNAALSADGLISWVLGAIILLVTVVGIIHETRESLLTRKWGPRVVAASETCRAKVFAAIERTYEMRFVSLFIMLALCVSTVAPTAALMEVEKSIVTRSCKALHSAGAMTSTTSPEHCAEIAIQGRASSVATTFGDTQNHFLQIAMWPLVAAVYGFFISLHFRFVRRPGEPITSVIERLPHTYHVFQTALAGCVTFVGFIQNSIGT